MIIVASAPLVGGPRTGGTDRPGIPEMLAECDGYEGGVGFGCALSMRMAVITSPLAPVDGLREIVAAYGRDTKERVTQLTELNHDLIRVGLDELGREGIISSPCGWEFTTLCQVPTVGMGLASSSALLAALFEAMTAQVGEKISPETIIWLCGRVERERLGRQIGDADPAVCVYGGWRRYEYRPTGIFTGSKIVVHHEKVEVAKNIPASFRYYRTHLPRASEDDLLSLGANAQSQKDLWCQMVNLTEALVKAAQLGDVEWLGRLLNESWHVKCQLTGVIDARVQTMIEVVKGTDAAAGVKSSGAGNSNLLVCAKPEKFPDISAALAEAGANEIVDFNGKPVGFGGDGSRVDARIPF